MDDYKWLKLAEQKAKAYQVEAHHALLRRIRRRSKMRASSASAVAKQVKTVLARVFQRLAKYLSSDVATNAEVRKER